MADFAFGARPSADARDARYPMRLLLDPLRDEFFPRGLPDGASYVIPGPVLDQGQTGTCVAHAGLSKVQASPFVQALRQTPFELYRLIVPRDPFSDNDHEATAPDADLQSGTDIRTCLEVLRDLGAVKNYLHAQDTDDIRAWHRANKGGVLMAVPMFTGMCEPTLDGIMHTTGVVEGWHAMVTTGWNDAARVAGGRRPCGRTQNSWSLRFADGGRGWITREGFDKLFSYGAQFMAAVEQRIQPPA